MGTREFLGWINYWSIQAGQAEDVPEDIEAKFLDAAKITEAHKRATQRTG